MESIDLKTSRGFFDGGILGDPDLCGDGAILFQDSSYKYQLKYAIGLGINNLKKFYVVYIFLKVVHEKGLKHLQVLGDSKIIIVWVNSK